ncbi:MAG: hypothetical protein KKH88_04915 [Nanoarchaeota archaeon]|nr:hypothetical protein [Nanoarchaeota archaeon]
MNKTILLVFLLIIVSLFLSGCASCPTCQECEECQETACPDIWDRPLVDIMVYNYGENIDNSNEILYDYWVYNYGNVEAKDIEVRCKIVDEVNNVVHSASDSYGNLASKSAQFDEFTAPNTNSYRTLPYNTLVTAVCYVESCSNCEILQKRIPDLAEVYNL